MLTQGDVDRLLSRAVLREKVVEFDACWLIPTVSCIVSFTSNTHIMMEGKAAPPNRAQMQPSQRSCQVADEVGQELTLTLISPWCSHATIAAISTSCGCCCAPILSSARGRMDEGISPHGTMRLLLLCTWPKVGKLGSDLTRPNLIHLELGRLSSQL